MVHIDLKRHKVVMTMALYEASRFGEMLKEYAQDKGIIDDPSLRTIINTLCDAGADVIQIPDSPIQIS